MRPIRLKLHYRYLADFDFMNKESQFTKNLVDAPKLDTLIAWSKLSQTNFEKDITLKALVLELLGNQKIFIKTTDKKFSDKLLFKLTFRKDNLFSFLDSCLNTIFLHDRKL